MNDRHRIKNFCLKEACSGKEEKKKPFPPPSPKTQSKTERQNRPYVHKRAKGLMKIKYQVVSDG
jgi:hypothetical protein